jgi:hemerythrin-like metal-binding protein
MKKLVGQLSTLNLLSIGLFVLKNIFMAPSIIIDMILFIILAVINIFYIKLKFDRLNSINKQIQELANGGGDLTLQFEEKGQDEISNLGKNLNLFIRELEQLIAKIILTSDKLADSSIHLSTNLDNLIDSRGKGNDLASLKFSMDNILENVTSQTAYSEEISSTTTQISSSIASVADMANNVNNLMSNTVKSAKKGEVALKENLDKFKIIEGTVGDIEKRSSELGLSSKKVYEIIDLINKITEQTNLLALNAAIEAARAGEAGKGFAVVADEVRKLANDSNSATKEIENLVTTILSEVDEVIKVTKEGSKEIKEGMQLTEETNKQILEVIKNVNETSTKVEEISRAMNDQTYAIGEITNATSESANKNIEINELTISQSEATEKMEVLLKESVNYSSSVSEVASALNNLTNTFKINKNVKINSNKIVEWNKSYSVSVKDLDKEHMYLFDLINNLNDAMLQGKSKENLLKIIDALADYTVGHFSHEEKLFKQTNYPEFNEHKIAHETFVNKVKEFRNKVNSGEAMVSIEIINFLKDWLINHIGIFDKKYAEHMNKNGIN